MAKIQTRRNVNVSERLYAMLSAHSVANDRSMSSIVEEVVNGALDAAATPEPASPAPVERQRRRQRCMNCDQPGHNARTCESPRMPRCFECDSTEHAAADCPEAARDAERIAVAEHPRSGATVAIPADLYAALAAEARAIGARTGRAPTVSQLAVGLLKAAIA